MNATKGQISIPLEDLAKFNLVEAVTLPKNLILASSDARIKVFHILNQLAGGKYGEEVSLPANDELLALCGISNHKTLVNALHQLEADGYLHYNEGKNEKGKSIRRRVVIRPLTPVEFLGIGKPVELKESERENVSYNVCYVKLY